MSGLTSVNITVVDDSTFFNNPNEVFDETSNIEVALDSRKVPDAPSRPLNPPTTNYPTIGGCTDSNAENYTPYANQDNGTCTYTDYSNIDWSSLDLSGYFNTADMMMDTGVSLAPDIELTAPAVLGCMDSNAENYNPNATVGDGGCTYASPVLAGNNIDDFDLSSLDSIDWGSVDLGGYFNPADMMMDTGVSLVPDVELTAPAVLGCMDSNAENYNPNATVGDGGCTYKDTDVSGDGKKIALIGIALVGLILVIKG